jgi:hypothetical protein
MIDKPKREKTMSSKPCRSLKSRIFRALGILLGATALATSLSSCSAVSSLKSAYEGEPFPQMPAPEIASYVLDLSGSTYPTAQLSALGSGIDEFLEGQSLGNPFSESPAAPRGLSIQFITKNSAQAPRILLVSAGTGGRLYEFITQKMPNLEGAIQLWDGLIAARTRIWQNAALQGDQTECANTVIEMLGRQQLLPDALKVPAGIICEDSKQTAVALKRLQEFVENPGIGMGSDVKGAIDASLSNLVNAKVESPTARLTLVIASDMVDEVSLALRSRLAELELDGICPIAIQDAGRASSDYSSIEVVIVGARNSKIDIRTLDKVQEYWTCYLNQIGIRNVTQRSDLSGF